jgi:hypothetical protein
MYMTQFDTDKLDGIKHQARHLSEVLSLEGGFEGGDGAWGRAFSVMADWLVTPEAEEYERIPSGKLADLAQEVLDQETGEQPFDEARSKLITMKSMTMLACGWADLIDPVFVYTDDAGTEHIIDKKAVADAMKGEPMLNPVTGLPDEDMEARTIIHWVPTEKLRHIRQTLAIEADPRPGM